MEATNIAKNKIPIIFSPTELAFLSNALNETPEPIEEWEFHTRMGEIRQRAMEFHTRLRHDGKCKAGMIEVPPPVPTARFEHIAHDYFQQTSGCAFLCKAFLYGHAMAGNHRSTDADIQLMTPNRLGAIL